MLHRPRVPACNRISCASTLSLNRLMAHNYFVCVCVGGGGGGLSFTSFISPHISHQLSKRNYSFLMVLNYFLVEREPKISIDRLISDVKVQGLNPSADNQAI